MNLTQVSLHAALHAMEECKAKIEAILNCEVDIEYKVSSSFSKSVVEYMLTKDHILTCVCYVLNLSPLLVKSKTRLIEIKNARFIAMALMYEYRVGGYKEIGEFFDGRDHTTAMNAVQKCADFRETETEFRQKYDACRNQCEKLRGFA